MAKALILTGDRRGVVDEKIQAILERHKKRHRAENPETSEGSLGRITTALIGQEEVAHGGHAMTVAQFLDLQNRPTLDSLLFMSRHDGRAADLAFLLRLAPRGLRAIVRDRLVLNMDRPAMLKPLSKLLQDAPKPEKKDPLSKFLKRDEATE